MSKCDVYFYFYFFIVIEIEMSMYKCLYRFKHGCDEMHLEIFLVFVVSELNCIQKQLMKSHLCKQCCKPVIVSSHLFWYFIIEYYFKTRDKCDA